MNRNLLIVVVVVLLLGGLFLISARKKTPEPAPIVPVVAEVKSTGPVVKVIGTSVEGRKIESYAYGQAVGTSTKHLVFVGGIHGGYEWNSVFLAYKLIDYLNANPAVIPKNVTVTVIPSANPDGLFKVIGKEGRFTAAEVPTNEAILASGRFNAHGVDLNRNFDCKWKPEATWKNKKVGAGTAAFSEPEALAFKNFVLSSKPSAVVFWHSQANAVYASECLAGILPQTMNITDAYSLASGYKAVKTFDAYPVTGDADSWLASISIPAISVELKTHDTIEWEQNLAGIKALFEYYSK